MPTALVTGASHGLGERYARELAARGYAVVLVDRDAGRVADAAERVGRATGAIVETIVADLADVRHVGRVERRLTADRLPIEVLVNAAGAADAAADPDGRLVAALVRLTRAAVAVMGPRARGGVVNVCGAPGTPGARVPDLTATVAASLPGTGVRVTAVVPGRDGSAGATPDLLDAVVRRSLADLDRGRTLSVPGRVHRAIAGYRESPRAVLRLAAKVTGAGRERTRRDVVVAGEPGHTRPSPVPGPFRDVPQAPRRLSAAGPAGVPVPPRRPMPPAPFARSRPAVPSAVPPAVPSVTPALPPLPALPPRPAHVPADDLPHPRPDASGPLPAVTPRAERAVRARRDRAAARPVGGPTPVRRDPCRVGPDCPESPAMP